MMQASTPISTSPLQTANQGAILPPSEMPAWFRTFLESHYIALMQEVNSTLRQLGRNPKRCPHCGGELK